MNPLPRIRPLQCLLRRSVAASFLLLVVATRPGVGSELPEPLPSQAKVYDEAMKSYDKTVEAQISLDRTTYQAHLTSARRYAEGGKRAGELKAIDADLAAVKAGELPAAAPANLPKDLLQHRERCRGARARAEAAVESCRRFTRENHRNWLKDLGAIAARGKDAKLAAAVDAELARLGKDATPEKAKPTPSAK